jgi:PLP dependent protein
MDPFYTLADRLKHIQSCVSQAARAPSTTLIAVSKMQTASSVAAAASAGQVDFGENYVQEGLAKIAALKPSFPTLVWHMIGPLQSNKTKQVAETFDWVHTLDRLKIAQRLSEQRPLHLPALNVLIQVNIDDETSKSGVSPESVAELAQAVSILPNLKLRGLMCIPKPASQTGFAQMQTLLKAVNAQGFNLDVLSMGMSADFAAALAYGATHIRIGTAIFGARH